MIRLYVAMIALIALSLESHAFKVEKEIKVKAPQYGIMPPEEDTVVVPPAGGGSDGIIILDNEVDPLAIIKDAEKYLGGDDDGAGADGLKIEEVVDVNSVADVKQDSYPTPYEGGDGADNGGGNDGEKFPDEQFDKFKCSGGVINGKPDPKCGGIPGAGEVAGGGGDGTGTKDSGPLVAGGGGDGQNIMTPDGQIKDPKVFTELADGGGTDGKPAEIINYGEEFEGIDTDKVLGLPFDVVFSNGPENISQMDFTAQLQRDFVEALDNLFHERPDLLGYFLDDYKRALLETNGYDVPDQVLMQYGVKAAGVIDSEILLKSYLNRAAPETDQQWLRSLDPDMQMQTEFEKGRTLIDMN